VFLHRLGRQALQGRELGHVDEFVDGLRPKDVGESLPVAVHRVEMHAALEQRLHKRRLRRLGRRRRGDVQSRVQVEVAAVGVGAALDQELDDVDGGEHADGIATHRRAIAGAGQVEWGGPVSTPGPDPEEFVDCLFDSEDLVFF